ncbi:transcriptional/translational regulatory protein YebC/TACO1 [Aminobacter aganoensis]|uniref:Transcriptional/translational regulatory protein YebC/TACO1 n=1 Tax=Aminobacter aganoensis TaxID=83264 RepID=A0A7X0KK77_9HYPH|nr:transcriptional/translational regulatory protein YebC/TACO1 [Aminobacter aganoensis]
MAKGQKRSNREIRKPKQEKASSKPESSFGNQIKVAANTNGPRGKGNP